MAHWSHWGTNSPNLDPPSSVADGFQSQQPARSRESFGQKSREKYAPKPEVLPSQEQVAVMI
jgi:hypothetical protein